MSYAKAYLKSAMSIMGTLGIILLASQAGAGDPMAVYFLYLSLACGIAGPIRVWIDERVKK